MKTHIQEDGQSISYDKPMVKTFCGLRIDTYTQKGHYLRYIWRGITCKTCKKILHKRMLKG